MLWRRLTVIFLFLLAFASPATASINGTFVSPTDASFLAGNVTVNVTFDGTANVTLEHNRTGTWQALNTTDNVTDAFTFIWQTANGSFPDGLYDLRVNVTNATNASDFGERLSLDLLVDNDAPVLLSNGTNSSGPAVGDNLTVSARWLDSALLNDTAFTVTFERATTGAFATSSLFETWTNAMLETNYTNATYLVNGSDEGIAVRFRVTLNDSQGRTNTTANLTVHVQNASPVLSVIGRANGSQIDTDGQVDIQMLDTGVGTDNTTLAVDASTGVGVTLAANGSLFSCSASHDGITENETCTMNVSWAGTGNVTFNFSARDGLGNPGNTTYTFTVVDVPDVVNVSVNGRSVATSTPFSSMAVNVTNASRELTFNWSVDALTGINVTTIAFLNVSDGQAVQRTSLPASVVYNVTAGVNLLTINTTLNDSALTDSVQLNLTANVPINLSPLRDQYVGGMITDWAVLLDGVNVTQQERFVNDTFDLEITIKNTTHTEPFSAGFNYSALDGLTLRWNATQDAFGFATSTSLESSLSSITASNVTIVLEHEGQTTLFFDNGSYLLAATFNFSLDNMTPYYQHLDGSGNTHQLSACAAAPTGPVEPGEACYLESGNETTLYLTRFEKDDRIVFGRWDARAPDITVFNPAVVEQSTLDLNLQVVTPNPNSTLCSYNVSEWNGSSSVLVTQDTVLLSAFTQPKLSWNHEVNITGLDDGQYNVTATCADDQSHVNTTVKNINISDTTLPTIYEVDSSSVTSDGATITGTADELVNFTVEYGTSSDNLSSSKTGQTDSLTASIELSGLSSDTTYHYNLTACDAKNQCNTSVQKTFTTSSAGNGGDGGGGGGGGGETGETTSTTSSESTDSRVWGSVVAGQNISYETSAGIVKTMAFTVQQERSQVLLTVKQYAENSSAVPKAFDGDVYRFILFEHQGLAENTDGFRFTFTVEKSWISGREVGLHRLEDDWRQYEIRKVSEDASVATYEAAVPELSWWAVAAAPQEAEPVVETSENVTTPTVEQETEEPAEEEPGFVSALEKERDGIHPAFLIAGLILVVTLLAFGGLKYYRIRQEKEAKHEEMVRRERRQHRRKRHGSFADLHEYIEKMRNLGHDDEHIKKRLVDVGWDSVIVEQEIAKD